MRGNVLTLMALVMIVVLIVGPSLMSGVSDMGDKLSDWVKYGFDFDDLTDGDDDEVNGDKDTEPLNSSGDIAMGVTINFMDGTSKTVGPEEMTFTLFPMTIYFEDKEISEIWWHVCVKVDWVGDLEELYSHGWLKVTTAGITVCEQELTNIREGDLVAHNMWYEIGARGMVASQLEDLLGSGEYTLHSEADITVEATFSDGHTETQSATGTADTTITIMEGTLTVFSVQIAVERVEP